MDEVTKDARESGEKKLIYEDDLVLFEDSEDEVEMRYARWKKKTMLEKD